MKRFLLFLLLVTHYASFGGEPVQTELFVAGKDGYHTYRIPSLIVTRKGTLLAFAEGRKNSRADNGNIDLVMKRSSDGGKTWSAQSVIWDDGENTCGNPCPVVDEKTGTIWLLLTHNLGTDHEKDIKTKTASKSRTVWVCHSKDDGRTWSEPVEITSMVKKPEWGWYATGPGVGIQIKHGPHKGRLVIPSDHSFQVSGRGSPPEFGSHSFHSDDGGRTWKLGGFIRPKMNECQVVEVADGRGTLLMDMRSYLGEKRRAHAVSFDGGESWSDAVTHPELIEPICQASMLRMTWSSRSDKSRILFSNPAHQERRRNMTVRLSYDEGKTWPVGKTLFPGPSAYSCLAVLPDKSVACLFERGETNSYDTITFATFGLDWLTDGADRIETSKTSISPTTRR